MAAISDSIFSMRSVSFDILSSAAPILSATSLSGALSASEISLLTRFSAVDTASVTILIMDGGSAVSADFAVPEDFVELRVFEPGGIEFP